MPATPNASARRPRALHGAAAIALLLSAAGALLAGCETEPSGPDPTVVRLNDMDQRLGRVERVVSNQSLVQLSQHVDQLDMELRELRGEVEQLQRANDTLAKQQRDFYADLDRRIAAQERASRGGGGVPGAAGAAGDSGPGEPSGAGPALAGGAAATHPPPVGGTGATSTEGAIANLAPPGGGATAPTSADGATNGGQPSDQSAYAHAFDTLKSGNYTAAITQFKQFLQDYPSSNLDDNAQYWLGESYYVTRDYDNAAAAFRTVGEKYPQSRKAPDALLKLGYTQLDQQQTAAGRATLQQVVQRFPMSDAAKLAAQRLNQLSQGSP